MNTTPLVICHICLRTDRRLYRLNYELEGYYEYITGYVQLSAVQFCGECITRLKRCYDFKNICITATEILKNWKKQKVSTPLSLLHRELSYPQFSLSNKKNFQVHFCQSSDLDSSSSFEVYTSKHPHIVTVNIPRTETENELKPIDNVVITNNIKSELESHYEHTEDVHITENDVLETKSEKFESDNEGSDSESDEKIVNKKNLKVKNEKICGSDTDSDESLNEFLVKYKKYKEENNWVDSNNENSETKERKIEKKVAKINIEFLRNKMREKFDKYNIVRDNKGNDIDIEVVLGCFDKLTFAKLLQIRKHCATRGPFSAKAIDMLSELHEEYADYDKMDYTIHYMHDDTQMAAEFEKRRHSSQYIESKHRCESCIRGYKSEGHVREHMNTAHNESNPFECTLCKTRCKNNYKLSTHMRSHRLVYKCKLCPFVTSFKTAVQAHCNRHAGVNYKCKECGKEFKNRSVMYCHYNSMHQPKHPCELCAFSSSSKNGLLHHKNRKHRGQSFIESESNRRCESCAVTFITEEVYQRHLKITHGDKSFSTRKPRRTDTGKPRTMGIMTCTLCGASGMGNIWLGPHRRTFHPEVVKTPHHKYLCDTCGKGFISLSLYQDHMNTHTGARPYKCPHCPKTFQRMLNLSVHRQRHLPPSHVCNYCGKKFTAASNLSNHIRIHVGNRRFKCEICGKGFLHNVSLRDHVNGVHYNIKKKRNRKMSQS